MRNIPEHETDGAVTEPQRYAGSTLGNIKVGDTLIRYGKSPTEPPAQVIVTQIGRRFIHVDYCGSEERFSRGEGRINDNHGDHYITTPQNYEFLVRRSEASGRLEELGVYFRDPIDVEKMEAIVEIMERSSLAP